jgi:hypothetical protein
MSLSFSRHGCVVAVALAALVFMGVSSAQAQYEPKYEFSVQGSYAQTFSALKDFASSGIGGSASLGYRYSDRLVIGADATLHSFQPNDSVTAAFSNNIDISSILVEGAGFAKLYTNTGNRRVYLRGSAGVFHARTSVNYLGLKGTGTLTDPGMSAGVGIELIGHRNSATYFEASYRRMLGEDVHWVSFSVGASFFIW